MFYHVFNVTGHTVRGLQQHVRILFILNVGLDEIGQMAVPSTCHLRYEQCGISQESCDTSLLPLHKNIISILFYLRVQGASNGHLPLFGKHIGHEKVAATGDCAIQPIRLTGKVYLKKQKNKNHQMG